MLWKIIRHIFLQKITFEFEAHCMNFLLWAKKIYPPNYVYLRLILKLVCITWYENCLRVRAQREGLDPETYRQGRSRPKGIDLTYIVLKVDEPQTCNQEVLISKEEMRSYWDFSLFLAFFSCFNSLPLLRTLGSKLGTPGLRAPVCWTLGLLVSRIVTPWVSLIQRPSTLDLSYKTITPGVLCFMELQCSASKHHMSQLSK